MFTGLIEEIGKIKKISIISEGKEFQIEAKNIVKDLKIGDSIAVDGACLTVVSKFTGSFSVQLIKETLTKTTFANLRTGDVVNLERAIVATARFGGHFVQGHIDGVVEIMKKSIVGNSAIFWVKVPSELMKYVALRGSIALNGVSLTVASIEGNAISISLIPYTLSETNLGIKKEGNLLNLEVDLLAKYTENLLKVKNEQLISEEKLKKWGYKNK